MSDPTESALQTLRCRLAGVGDFTVVATDNRVSMLTVRRRGRRSEVRVARRLLLVGEVAINAVVTYLRGGAGGRAQVQQILRGLPAAPTQQKRRPRRVAVRTLGDHYDLAPLVALERARHFPEMAPVAITWGARPRRGTQRSIRMGTYDARGPLIRIHRRLDDPRVPEWFIGFVIYHELVHHHLGVGPPDSGGRRQLHGPEFRRIEGQHPRYEDAQVWEAGAHEILFGA